MAIFIDDLKTVDDLGNQLDLSALVEDAAGGSDEPPRVRTGRAGTTGVDRYR